MTGAPGRFAVVGAGIAGLACAKTLKESGVAVSVFEKDAVPGGRSATVIETVGPFDHGAQYFTIESDRFASVVRRWRGEGVVDYWRARIVAFGNGMIEDKSASVERFVAVPGMRRLGVFLAQGLDVQYSTMIGALDRRADGWYLRRHAEAETPEPTAVGPFDAVCVALPSDAAAALLDGHTALVEQARTVRWEPCWATLLALAKRSGVDFDAAFINDDPILGWVANDTSKPRRGRVEGIAERWVLHAKPRWSRRYVDMEEAHVARWLGRSFSARLRRNLNPVHLRALRWPQATPLNPLKQRFLWDESLRVGMAGDWCGGPSVEGAYTSGQALAEAALG